MRRSGRTKCLSEISHTCRANVVMSVRRSCSSDSSSCTAAMLLIRPTLSRRLLRATGDGLADISRLSRSATVCRLFLMRWCISCTKAASASARRASSRSRRFSSAKPICMPTDRSSAISGSASASWSWLPTWSTPSVRSRASSGTAAQALRRLWRWQPSRTTCGIERDDLRPASRRGRVADKPAQALAGHHVALAGSSKAGSPAWVARLYSPVASLSR